ncbi:MULTISPECIES: hypothetical protein [unclassified Cupriavidus]|uniref:hypothetical protein n=1 Tax=unclassified Cupriavidus TaxID=2640874 RepID=UPI0010F82CE5|nr:MULTISPECIES: hypothetical protein [unclassified Cupriavidus]MWL88771.1 hypothetical protein [Cupriavidus sp. SW-Y-13]
MRFHPDLHFKDAAGKLHWPHWSHGAHARPDVVVHHHSVTEDAEVAQALVYVSVITALVLLAVLAGISFGQEAMHWLGVA